MAKVCLITGGSRGIGRATAMLAAAQGWDIAVGYQENAAAAAQVVAELASTGHRAIAVAGDVANERNVVALFDETERQLGPITGLVNSAGLSVASRIADLDPAIASKMFAVNVIGTMLCCREAARRMSTSRGGRGGSIVNLSSMAATIGGRPSASVYAATKGAIDVFTTGFAREVAAEGIRVNAVRPGMTATDMAGANHGAAQRVEIAKTIPMGRLGQPGESAEAIVWLLSDKSSFVTGAHINVSGGGFHVGLPLV